MRCRVLHGVTPGHTGNHSLFWITRIRAIWNKWCLKAFTGGKDFEAELWEITILLVQLHSLKCSGKIDTLQVWVYMHFIDWYLMYCCCSGRRTHYNHACSPTDCSLFIPAVRPCTLWFNGSRSELGTVTVGTKSKLKSRKWNAKSLCALNIVMYWSFRFSPYYLMITFRMTW